MSRWTVVVAAFAASLALQGARADEPRPGRSSDGVRVTELQLSQIKTEPVQSRTFRREYQAFGHIAYNEDAVTPVYSPFSGRATRLLAKPGDSVQPGTPLIEIRSSDVVQIYNELNAARISFGRSQERAAHLKRLLDRQLSLFAAKAAPQRDVENARSEHDAALAELAAAAGLLEAARTRFETMLGRSSDERAQIEAAGAIEPLVVIKSPIAGTVISRKVGVGQVVRSDGGEALLAIADLSTVWLKMSIPESRAADVRTGDSVQVTLSAFPGRQITGLVTAVSSLLDATTRRIVVRSELPNPDGALKAEMFASGRIIGAGGEASPAVPIGAVLRDADLASVWLATGKREFKRREVTLGLEQGGFVQVRSGVAVGETIVAAGAIFLDNEWRQ